MKTLNSPALPPRICLARFTPRVIVWPAKRNQLLAERGEEVYL